MLNRQQTKEAKSLIAELVDCVGSPMSRTKIQREELLLRATRFWVLLDRWCSRPM